MRNRVRVVVVTSGGPGAITCGKGLVGRNQEVASTPVSTDF